MASDKIILASLLMFISQIKQFSAIENNDEQIKAINVEYKMPIVNPDSSLFFMESFYDVYYFKDLIMYKLNYGFSSVFNDTTMLSERRYYYFVFQKDSAYGIKYFIKPDLLDKNKRVKKDSLLKYNSQETKLYDTLTSFEPDSVHRETGKLIKFFKDPVPQPDTVACPEKFDLYFYYSDQLKGISETFSRKMDNEKGLKLYKILVAAKGAYYKTYKMTFPPRDFILEMKPIEVQNKDEILGYFKKYQERKL